MSQYWRRLQERVGSVALLAIGLLGLGLLVLAGVIRPLEARLERLETRLWADGRKATESTRRGTPSAKLAAFYGYFDRKESQVDWLAKLYGSAQAAGLNLRAADYRRLDTDGRVIRYEITLPLSGTYAQLRTFLEDVLEENPILSLDQLSMRRKRVNDTLVDAEAVLTIHLLAE